MQLKKITKLGVGASLSLAAILATTSLTIARSHEYIFINLHGNKKIFKNIDEASKYIMSNEVFADRKMKLGNPKFLNTNAGIIDPDSLYDYAVDKEHTSPAYKMMNGKYTRSRNKALQTYLGRSHLVAQYYDGINFHDGNSIGLKQAKDAILSRQLEETVPYYSVKLANKRTLNINPFNKKDVEYLQEEAFKIYKSPNSAYDHVGTTYLLPTKVKNEKIAVLPNDPAKGLQPSDILSGVSIENLLTKWLKSQITFDFEVEVVGKAKNPYKFWRREGSFDYFGSRSNYNLRPYVRFDGEENKTIGTKMEFKNISYDYFDKHKHYFDAFMTYQGFWNHFNEGQNSSGGKDYSTWGKPASDKNVFGAKVVLANNYPKQHGSWSGWDVTINNDKGSWREYKTTSKLTPFIYDKKNINAENFLKSISASLNSNVIFSRLANNVKTEILNTLNGGTKTKDKSRIQNIIDNFKGEFSKSGSLKAIKNGSMKTYNKEDYAHNVQNSWKQPVEVAKKKQ